MRTRHIVIVLLLVFAAMLFACVRGFGQTTLLVKLKQLQRASGTGFVPITNAQGMAVWTPAPWLTGETDPIFVAHPAYGISSTNITEWGTSYTERRQWDGGSTNLVAATGRTSLGATTVGGNIFVLPNPSAVRYIRINADNSVTARTAAEMVTDLNADPSITNEGALTALTVSTTVVAIHSNTETTTDITLREGAGMDFTQAGNQITIASTVTQADGSETKINAGTNVTVTGAGTTASPYVVNSTASGGVSGLTTGYIPKAASATTLTNSLFQENATGIGIGGTPTQRFQVFGGDMAINMSTATTTFGMGNDGSFGSGETARFQFGDHNNQITNSWGGTMKMTSYWGTEMVNAYDLVNPIARFGMALNDYNTWIRGKVGMGAATVPTNAKMAVSGNVAIGSGYYNNAPPTNGLLIEGNVGIGNTTGAEKLHVTGNVRVSSLASTNTRSAVEADANGTMNRVNYRSGTSTFTANGNDLSYSFAHGAAFTPTWKQVQLASVSLATSGSPLVISSAQVSSTNITVNFTDKPASGDVVIDWEVR
jgi:hypothetical protein